MSGISWVVQFLTKLGSAAKPPSKKCIPTVCANSNKTPEVSKLRKQNCKLRRQPCKPPRKVTLQRCLCLPQV